jgi:hypothetical protein
MHLSFYEPVLYVPKYIGMKISQRGYVLIRKFDHVEIKGLALF